VLAAGDRIVLVLPGQVAIYDHDGHPQQTITASPTQVVADQDRIVLVLPGQVAIYDHDGHLQQTMTVNATQVALTNDGILVVQASHGGALVSVLDHDGKLRTTITTELPAMVGALGNGFAILEGYPLANTEIDLYDPKGQPVSTIMTLNQVVPA
jgi:hypothetical protein